MLRFDTTQMKTSLGRLQDKLLSIERISDHAAPLMESWERIMIADNLEGVLAGTDRYGHSMVPVTYRPVGNAKKLTVAQRLGQHPRKKRGDFYGIGDHASGLNNNLTSVEYRQLGGPPLCRGGSSAA